MKIGICLPYMARDYDRARILSWIRKIDQGPFDSLSCGERITGPTPTYEMNSLVAAAAAVTERVRLLPALYVLPMRSAVFTAKEIATLDVISGGRMAVTVGVGGRDKDYRAVGASFERRHQRLDEQVAEMRKVWRGEPPFDGADPVGPTPVQGDRIPIYAGSMGPKSMARAAKWADGVYAPALTGAREENDFMFKMARDAWAENGRADKPYLITSFWYSLAPNAQQELRQYVYDYMKTAGHEMAEGIAGSMTRHTPEAVKEAIENARAAGADEVILLPSTVHYDEIDRVSELLR